MGARMRDLVLTGILLVTALVAFSPLVGNAAGRNCRKTCVTEYTDTNGCQVIRTEYYSCDGEYLGAVTVWYC